jgi:hypothetical protein
VARCLPVAQPLPQPRGIQFQPGGSDYAFDERSAAFKSV